jgi:hypothetical protein
LLVGIALFLVGLLTALPVRAQIAVFNDDFDGTSLSSAWTNDGSPEIDPSGSTITVADGVVTIASNQDDQQYTYVSLWGGVDQLAGLGSSNDWTAEIRFKYSGRLATPDATRNVNLLSGMQGLQAHMANAGIDFRLEQDLNGDEAETLNLSWNGHTSSNLSQVPDLLANLNKDVFYTLTGHRKPDDTVDIFLDGNLLTTMPVLGVGNPDNFRIGESAGSVNLFETGRLVIDYIKVESAVSAGVPGDFNDDGTVDAADYVVWRKLDTSSTPLPNDAGQGTPIGIDHYTLWRANFGRQQDEAGQGSGLVPEPSSIIPLIIGVLVCGISRKGCGPLS